MTRADRIEKVQEAADALARLIADARHAEAAGWPTAPEWWERVEKAGATVHRQARLLAGKTKGG